MASLINAGETEKPLLTTAYGQLHNQPDTSNIQQRLSDTLKLLGLGTPSRENHRHDHKSPITECVFHT